MMMRDYPKLKRILPAVAATVLLLFYFGALVRDFSSVAGGSDNSGYLNTMKLIRRGEILFTPPTPAPIETGSNALQPLGFVPGPAEGTLAPYYSPGLPILLAASSLLTPGDDGAFLVVPLLSTLSLLLIGLIAIEIGLSKGYAFAAAAALGLFPSWVMHSIQVMSDVPGTFWALAAAYAALRSERSPAAAFICGLAFAIGIITRPTNGLLLLPLVWIFPLRLRPLSYFIAGGIAPGLFLAGWNAVAYGNPFSTGYAETSLLNDLSVTGFLDRFQHYVQWLTRPATPLLAAGWLALPFLGSVRPRLKGFLLTWFAVWLLFYCFYRHYDAWWYTRFLLPALPALIIGAMATAHELLEELRPRSARLATALAVLLVSSVLLTQIDWISELHARDFAKVDRPYAESIAVARARLPHDTPLLSMQTSGAITYYTGLTPVRWDLLSPDEITRIAESVAAGNHWYALLFDFEIEDAQQRIPLQWRRIDQIRHISLWVLEPASEPI
jgi:hypothetical protein